MFGYFEKKKLSSLRITIARENLIKNGRILFIDDEEPELIEDLKKSGFAVDIDVEGNSTNNIEKGIYDLIVLDYGGVGKKYGENEGLDLLKQIKRVNPSVYVLAYTSKNLNASQSEFFRLTDATLKKDEGLQDSEEKIEDSLKKAFDPNRKFKAALKLLEVEPESKLAITLEDLIVRSIENRDAEKLKKKLGKIIGDSSKKLAGKLLLKAVETAISSYF